MTGANRTSTRGRPTVAVIVCAYTEDRWDDLVRATESLERQTVAPSEVIVVVDHNPGLLERARGALPGAGLVSNRHEQGLSGARNTGLEDARADIVAFLDDDAVAARDWLERILECYDDDRVLAVGGSVEPDWLDGRPRAFPSEFDWVVGCSYRGMPRTRVPVRNVIGANMSFRREVFREIGSFRTGIGRVGTRPLGCEETELCIRARQRWPEARIVYEPAARVTHAVPRRRGTWSYFLSRCYAEGLSKALVARATGARDGLESERSYALQTLPRGVAAGVAAALRGDPAGLGRAAAIVVGLGVTTVGYVVGRARLTSTVADAEPALGVAPTGEARA